MNYNKLLKYTNKYNNLNRLKGGKDDTIKYSSLLVDSIQRTDCDEPSFIRVLKNEDTNKLVILLGERHSEILSPMSKNYKKGPTRLTSNQGIDYYFGQISKRISHARSNYDESNPFNKVLFLNELQPSLIALNGGRIFYYDDDDDEIPEHNIQKIHDEFDLEVKFFMDSLSYVDKKTEYITQKYSNTIKRAMDLRQVLNIGEGQLVIHLNTIRSIMGLIHRQQLETDFLPDVDFIDELKIQYKIISENVENAIENIKKYIIDDTEFLNDPQILKERNPPFVEEENKKFFGPTYNRRHPMFGRKFSEIFIHTRDLYTNVRELFIDAYDEYVRNPKILINPAFDHLSLEERNKLYFKTVENLFLPIVRIMDLYALEYLSLMPNNSTTVIYTGSAHSKFYFNELCILENYKLVEIERMEHYMFHPTIFDCQKTFPSFDSNIKQYNNFTKRLYTNYLTKSPDEKNRFLKNILLISDNYYSEIEYSLSFSKYLGKYENLIMNKDIDFLFNNDIADYITFFSN